ncbi:hypothetical protein [Arthrobacter methylotrophus]|uniref:hypothetical protein n=1 Tax=Arthrobacter methylotrophus TaxID=121291 RepID=UPI0031EF381C
MREVPGTPARPSPAAPNARKLASGPSQLWAHRGAHHTMAGSPRNLNRRCIGS